MNLQPVKLDNPTPQQKQAIESINEFILSNKLTYTLKGYAGTGKTHLLKYFLLSYKGNCCVTTPTHKALRVVENRLNRKGKTLQSLLGLRLNVDLEDFDISNPKFEPIANEYIRGYNLIIIDECSMINSSLYDLLRLKASQYNVKLLFTGDPCQLPPVHEQLSKSFISADYSFELTDIVRQKDGNPLLDLLSLCRNDILNASNDFYPHLIKKRKDIVNHSGFLLLNDIDFKKVIIQYYKHERFFKDVNFIRTVAWTNYCVSGWNKFIRNSIFDNPPEILHEYDLLTAYTTIVDDFNSPIIINSEDYIISQLRNYTDSDRITAYAVNLKNIYDERGLETSTLKIVNPHNAEGFTRFYQMLCVLHYRAINSRADSRKLNWRNYYTFKNNHLNMFGFKLSRNNDNAFVKKDIDYGYALTIHKSQGSTYDNIAIDLDDIMFNKSENAPEKSLRDKLIYVALSRATNIAIIKL